MTRAGGDQQDHLATVTAPGIRVDTCAQKKLDNRGVAPFRGQPDQRDAIAVRQSYISPGLDQAGDRLEVPMMRRPMQRRGPIGPGCVDIDALTQQVVNRQAIEMANRFDERRVHAATGDGTRHSEKRICERNRPARA